MVDIALTADGSDIDLTNNELSLVRAVDSVAQHWLIRMRFFLGEWFLDEREGIAYFERVLVKSPDLIAVKSLLREASIKTAGVEKIERFDTNYDPVARRYSISASAFVVGETDPVELGAAFIVGASV
jgi:hypothetical protein